MKLSRISVGSVQMLYVSIPTIPPGMDPDTYADQAVEAAQRLRRVMTPKGVMWVFVRDWIFGWTDLNPHAVAAERNARHDTHASRRVMTKDYDLMGVLGEFEFARHFGLRPHVLQHDGGDDGVDFRVGGYTIDVKTSKTPFLRQGRDKKTADIFVLYQYYEANRTVAPVGWCFREALLENEVPDLGSGQPGYRLPADRLRDIGDLKALLGVRHSPGDRMFLPFRVAMKLQEVGLSVRGWTATPKQSAALLLCTGETYHYAPLEWEAHRGKGVYHPLIASTTRHGDQVLDVYGPNPGLVEACDQLNRAYVGLEK